MRVDRINYQKTFNLGNYTSERIGMEAELEAGDDAEFQLANLKKAVEDLHKSSNPGLYVETIYDKMKSTETFTSLSPTPLPSIDYKAIERLEICIDNAVTMEELDNLRVEVQRYSKDRPGLAEVFNKRLIEISPSDN